MAKKILDVGCGNKKTVGAIGIDISSNTQADVVHNLNEFPWPFEDNTFDEIICNDVLEHLDDVLRIMEELHRIGKPNAIVKIRIPHFTSHSSYSDITHKHQFGLMSFDGFCGKSYTQSHYSEKRFKMISRKIQFGKLYKFVGLFANMYPEKYERYFAFVFPAGNIEFILQIEK